LDGFLGLKETSMAIIDEQTGDETDMAAGERRRSGRVEFENPHLVRILRLPDVPLPDGFDPAMFAREQKPATRSRLLETVLASLAFWCLAVWLLLACVG